MNDTTGIETTGGDVLLVEIDQRAQVIRFLDDNDQPIRVYRLDTFASVTTGLVLDEGASIVIDADTVAALKIWADIDAGSR
jgi:dihydropteroate synthase